MRAETPCATRIFLIRSSFEASQQRIRDKILCREFGKGSCLTRFRGQINAQEDTGDQNQEVPFGQTFYHGSHHPLYRAICAEAERGSAYKSEMKPNDLLYSPEYHLNMLTAQISALIFQGSLAGERGRGNLRLQRPAPEKCQASGKQASSARFQLRRLLRGYAR